jgi:hypothetical protein
MVETLLSYGNDAASTHVTNSFWCNDVGNLLPTDPMASDVFDTNIGFGLRWDRIKQSRIENLWALAFRYLYCTPLPAAMRPYTDKTNKGEACIFSNEQGRQFNDTVQVPRR